MSTHFERMQSCFSVQSVSCVQVASEGAVASGCLETAGGLGTQGFVEQTELQGEGIAALRPAQ